MQPRCRVAFTRWSAPSIFAGSHQTDTGDMPSAKPSKPAAANKPSKHVNTKKQKRKEKETRAPKDLARRQAEVDQMRSHMEQIGLTEDDPRIQGVVHDLEAFAEGGPGFTTEVKLPEVGCSLMVMASTQAHVQSGMELRRPPPQPGQAKRGGHQAVTPPVTGTRSPMAPAHSEADPGDSASHSPRES